MVKSHVILYRKFVKMAATNNVKKKVEVVAREHGYVELKEEQKRLMIKGFCLNERFY